MLKIFSLCICLFIIAIAFAAVGHGGASGYTAILLLFGYSAESIRPVVLCMNIVVTTWILFNNRTQEQNHSLFFTLIFASTPAAFVGGSMSIDTSIYKIIIGLLLLASAARLLLPLKSNGTTVKPKLGFVILVGALLGWLSGLTGIGGGVLLSPLLLLLAWCTIRESITLVAGFILINSIAGLGGYYLHQSMSLDLPWWMIGVAFTGGLVGSYWTKTLAKSLSLTRLLAGILIIAGGKMLISAF